MSIYLEEDLYTKHKYDIGGNDNDKHMFKRRGLYDP